MSGERPETYRTGTRALEKVRELCVAYTGARLGAWSFRRRARGRRCGGGGCGRNGRWRGLVRGWVKLRARARIRVRVRVRVRAQQARRWLRTVHEAVGDVKVQVAPERHQHHPEQIPREEAAAAEDL
eukprot:scaffold111312_cov57-Phaeocystis_antarctica.AAC.1